MLEEGGAGGLQVAAGGSFRRLLSHISTRFPVTATKNCQHLDSLNYGGHCQLIQSKKMKTLATNWTKFQNKIFTENPI